MCAVCAQCASVRPIQPFYLTKLEVPYNAFSPITAWADPQQKVRDGGQHQAHAYGNFVGIVH
jgi:hypothetical protein